MGFVSSQLQGGEQGCVLFLAPAPGPDVVPARRDLCARRGDEESRGRGDRGRLGGRAAASPRGGEGRDGGVIWK